MPLPMGEVGRRTGGSERVGKCGKPSQSPSCDGASSPRGRAKGGFAVRGVQEAAPYGDRGLFLDGIVDAAVGFAPVFDLVGFGNFSHACLFHDPEAGGVFGESSGGDFPVAFGE